MECPSCQAEVPEGKRFCMECGAPTRLPCPACGSVNPPNAKFCGDCGANLDRSTAPAARRAAARPEDPSSSAERRHLTVMFCDLVNSTALSVRLDPEDLRKVIGSYHKCVSDIVGRFEGFVGRYMGDGVLVCFGYPQAQEDDAERAVRAGLELVAAIPSLKARADTELQCRIGIATGLVVVGDLVGRGEAQERGIVGETPNLAARLQALAAPGDVVIAQTTRRLVGNLFDFRDLGTVDVKGIAAPVQAWQALRSSAAESRFEALHLTALTPLVGREEEIELLLRRWGRAKAGDGQVVLLSGEPGIGKSRLAIALEEKLQNEPHTRMRYFCSPHQSENALHPIISQLRRAAGLERDDAPETSLKKLEALLAPSVPSDDEVQLFAGLLSIPTSNHYPRLDVTPQRRREKTFEALLRQLDVLARRQLVLIMYEDVHWIDPTSRDLLDLTIERARRLPVLLLVTFRPDFQPPWIGQPHVTTVVLSRLGRRDGAALVAGIIGNKELSPNIVEEIVDRTDGVPLFVEELTKAVIEAGAQDDKGVIAATAHSALAVPATLHASLMARLDRLGPSAKEVAQIGAAIGREFSYDVLAAVARQADTELQSALVRLTDAGLVFRRGTPPDALFLFKHTLVQDVAYGMLLRSERQTLHARIVEVLEGRFPQIIESEPAILARHSAEAGLIEKAADYFGRAGKQAIARSAMTEAVAMVRKALLLIAELPDDAARWRRELALQSALGIALIAVKGYAATEVGEVYERARVLCDQLEDVEQLIRVASGQVSFHIVRAEVIAARRTAEAFLQVAETAGTPEARFTAHQLMGTSVFHQGQFIAARAHLETAALEYTACVKAIDVPSRWSGADPRIPGIAVPSWLAVTLCLLGRYREARVQCELALTEARRSRRLHWLAFALGANGWLYQLLREEAELLIDELALISKEQGFPYWAAMATLFRAAAAARHGKQAEASALFQEGVRAHRALGARSMTPSWAALVAPVLGPDEAEVLLAEQLNQIEMTDERWCEAEIHRMRGEVAWRRGDLAAAQAYLMAALALARQQEARHWELRAATGLARLWYDEGRCSEARDLLVPVYGRFTETVGTPDLKEAKVLLDNLRD
jgi:class 3 adenylate cyclase/tetratricopeptide (TPR) repeat protein